MHQLTGNVCQYDGKALPGWQSPGNTAPAARIGRSTMHFHLIRFAGIAESDERMVVI